jgi:outer membrane protein OmpA-like peptidoglycan-associated protein
MATEIHDDYLICKEYHEQIGKKSTTYPDFITFQHENGNHYFAWVNGENIIMRSEAYPDADKMERGIKAILKNWDLTERYSLIEEHGAHMLVLWGGGDHTKHTGNRDQHSEIGRSCPKGTREELNAMMQFKGNDFANKIIPVAHSSAAAASNKEANETASNTTANVVAAATGAAAMATSATAQAKSTATNTVHETTNKASSMATSTVNTVSEDSSGGGMGWLKWLLPLLLLGAAIWAWKSCNKSGDAVVTSDVITTDASVAADAGSVTAVDSDAMATNTITAADSNSSATANTTTTSNTTSAAIESMKVKLADGVEINANKGGIEDGLVRFLDNKSAAFNAEDKKANWYNFDNLNFDLGKSTITKASMVQIDNLAAILKAYPALKIKVGGYTDKAGNDTKNMTLSQSRADAVVAALKAKGANVTQLVGAEGYGETLATQPETASEEARRVDRRTAVRVMAR